MILSPTGYDAVEEEDIAENPIAEDNNASDDPLLQAAMLEHCEALEIDPKKHPEFVYIAKESLLAPVPEGWKEHRHEDGNPFYVNLETGVSQWDHPSDKYYSKKFKKLLKERKMRIWQRRVALINKLQKARLKKVKALKVVRILLEIPVVQMRKVSKVKKQEKPKK